MSLLPLWIPGSVPGSLSPDENTLPKPSQGRVIPRWNRLDKRNRSMKKIPLCAHRTPAARENAFRSLNKPPKNDCLDAEREPSNARLPEVYTQRQTDKIMI